MFHAECVFAVSVSSAGESAKTLTLLRNRVVRLALQEFTCYKLEKKDKRYVGGTVMSISRLVA